MNNIAGFDYGALEAHEARMANHYGAGNQQQGFGLPPGQDEAGVYPEFYTEDLPNSEKSKEAGRPICETVEFVRIVTAGNPDAPVQRVDAEVKRRFPQAYARWKSTGSQDDTPPGTPLTAYPPLHSTRAKELFLMGIKTVEQLIEIPDAQSHRFGPDIQSLQQRAKTWMQAAKDASVIEKLHAKMDEMAMLLQSQTDRVALLEKELNDAGIKPKARRGRIQDGEE